MTYSMTSVGDIIIGRPFSGPAGPRQAVRTVLGNTDHCLVNLELPLTESLEQADKLICLKAPPSLAAELSAFGVDVATFANNHALDFGVTGLRDTLDALDKACQSVPPLPSTMVLARDACA
jgi:poly-gamma-glutamate synthesis protein (capsule biosynthesis protein)